MTLTMQYCSFRIFTVIFGVMLMLLTSSHVQIFGSDIPIIVWWTTPTDQTALNSIQCGEKTCDVTNNRKFLHSKRTKAFMFYGTFIDLNDLPLPRRHNHQWGLVHEESPMNNYFLVHRPFLEQFNYTSTFRRESDLPLTTFSLESLDYLTKRLPVSTAEKNRLQKDGLAPIAYIQSHCGVASDRDRFVQELMKYIAIDSYGSCLHNKDLPKNLRDPVASMEDQDFFDTIAKYKFHLSYENAICDDYMTEKLFRPLHLGSVPIYRGSPKVKDWLPAAKSAIIIDEFSSPKDLAEYIKLLNENDTAYEEMLAFKTTGIQNAFLEEQFKFYSAGMEDFFHSFECYVCSKVFDNYQRELKGEPIQTQIATVKHLQCPQPDVSIGTIEDIKKPDSWLDQYWIDDYWDGLDKALAVERMIQNNESNPSSFEKYWRKIASANPRPIPN